MRTYEFFTLFQMGIVVLTNMKVLRGMRRKDFDTRNVPSESPHDGGQASPRSSVPTSPTPGAYSPYIQSTSIQPQLSPEEMQRYLLSLRDPRIGTHVIPPSPSHPFQMQQPTSVTQLEQPARLHQIQNMSQHQQEYLTAGMGIPNLPRSSSASRATNLYFPQFDPRYRPPDELTYTDILRHHLMIQPGREESGINIPQRSPRSPQQLQQTSRSFPNQNFLESRQEYQSHEAGPSSLPRSASTSNSPYDQRYRPQDQSYYSNTNLQHYLISQSRKEESRTNILDSSSPQQSPKQPRQDYQNLEVEPLTLPRSVSASRTAKLYSSPFDLPYRPPSSSAYSPVATSPLGKNQPGASHSTPSSSQREMQSPGFFPRFGSDLNTREYRQDFSTPQTPEKFSPPGQTFQPPAVAPSLIYEGEYLKYYQKLKPEIHTSESTTDTNPPGLSVRERWLQNLSGTSEHNVLPFIQTPDRTNLEANKSIDLLAKRLAESIPGRKDNNEITAPGIVEAYENLYGPTSTIEQRKDEPVSPHASLVKKSGSFKEALLRPQSPAFSKSKDKDSETFSPSKLGVDLPAASPSQKVSPSTGQQVDKPTQLVKEVHSTSTITPIIPNFGVELSPNVYQIQFGSFEHLPVQDSLSSSKKPTEVDKETVLKPAEVLNIKNNEKGKGIIIPQDIPKNLEETDVQAAESKRDRTEGTDSDNRSPFEWGVLVVPCRGKRFEIDVLEEIYHIDEVFKKRYTKIYATGAVLVICQSEEEANYLRQAVAESDLIRVKPYKVFPREVTIENISNEKTEEEICEAIEATYQERPNKVIFMSYNDKKKRRNLQLARIEINSSLLEKMERSPKIKIGERQLRVDTSIRVDRCSNCRLLGHRTENCFETARSMPSRSEPCIDCANYNKNIQKSKYYEQYRRKTDHATGADDCETKRYFMRKWEQNQQPFEATKMKVEEETSSGTPRRKKWRQKIFTRTKEDNKNFPGKGKTDPIKVSLYVLSKVEGVDALEELRRLNIYNEACAIEDTVCDPSGMVLIECNTEKEAENLQKTIASKSNKLDTIF